MNYQLRILDIYLLRYRFIYEVTELLRLSLYLYLYLDSVLVLTGESCYVKRTNAPCNRQRA